MFQDGEKTFDFKKIENKYGSDFANNIKNDIIMVGELNATKNYGPGPIDIKDQTQYSGWTDCMIGALKDHFGVSAVAAAIEGGLWGYLQKKAYKEAAKLLVKFVIGSNAAGLAATLIYYGSVCTYRHG
uniref:hypothetical protein n=1 Tax=Bacillus sp. DX2.2 TaxID=3073452 RepID=UPI00402A76B1